MGTHKRDDFFSTKFGIVNLHSTKGTHWICYVGKDYFDSYRCAPPKNILSYIKSKHDKSVLSQYQFHKKNIPCRSYCLYILFCMFLFSMDFKRNVLNL